MEQDPIKTALRLLRGIHEHVSVRIEDEAIRNRQLIQLVIPMEVSPPGRWNYYRQYRLKMLRRSLDESLQRLGQLLFKQKLLETAIYELGDGDCDRTIRILHDMAVLALREAERDPLSASALDSNKSAIMLRRLIDDLTAVQGARKTDPNPSPEGT